MYRNKVPKRSFLYPLLLILASNLIYKYRQVSNISGTLVGNKILDHSDVVGAAPVGSNCIFILDLTPGFIGLGKDNCKTRRGAKTFGDLVRLIIKILRYILNDWHIRWIHSFQPYMAHSYIWYVCFPSRFHCMNHVMLFWLCCVMTIHRTTGSYNMQMSYSIIMYLIIVYGRYTSLLMERQRKEPGY